jgi:ribosome maturation factor RimP
MFSKKDMKGGQLSPLLLGSMELKEQVLTLLKQAFEKRNDLFLIDFSIDEKRHIEVIIDGDKGVSIGDCVEVSRTIEHQIDREIHDFSLSVQSAGATAPLKMVRQYPQHIGRTIKVKLGESEVKGKLIEISDEEITLEWSERVPKEIGKGKQTVIRKETIAYNIIDQAHIVLTF